MSEARIVTNTDYVVTETTFEARQSIAEIVQLLRARKTTGQFIIHLSQGGIQKIALTEKTKTGSASTPIRRIMGWEEK